MEKQEKIRMTIASNIVYYRKQCNLKQIYVAEKIGYSDKAISKWERGDGVPDIYTLHELAELFGITVNDLLSDKKKKRLPSSNRNKALITMLSVGLTWLVATIVAVFTLWLGKGQPWLDLWWFMSFIYAIPVSMIVLLIFNKLWGKRIFAFFIVSALIWTVGLSLERSFTHFIDWAYLFYILCIPLEVLTIFWFMLKKKTKGYSSDLK
jgi:transcriptional regulator with XRE-family HTH domain